jgi:predicted acetyltransferase
MFSFFFRTKPYDINFGNIHLIKPTLELRNSFRQAVSEHRRNRVEDFYCPCIFTKWQFMDFLQELSDRSAGFNLSDGMVPSTSYWLTDGTHYLGSGEIRHRLTDSLMNFGGHIGYSVRPSAWNRGLGTIQLALLLKKAKKMGLKTVRITCFEENAASAKVIEKNGAVLVGRTYNEVRGEERLTRIYEITT